MYLVKLYNIFYDREISKVTMYLSAYLIKDSFIICPPIYRGECSIEKNVVGLQLDCIFQVFLSLPSVKVLSKVYPVEKIHLQYFLLTSIIIFGKYSLTNSPLRPKGSEQSVGIPINSTVPTFRARVIESSSYGAKGEGENSLA